MNMFARFDENPAMTFQDIKETKRYGRMHARTDNVKTVYTPQTKFAGGIKMVRRVNENLITWKLPYATMILFLTPYNGKHPQN